MAGFKFRYQKVLDLRLKEEEEKKKTLASKIKDMERIKRKLEDLRSQRGLFEQKMLQEMQDGVSASRLSIYGASKKWYRQEIEDYESRLELSKAAIRIARLKLLQAAQEVKKIEKLKEKAYEEFKAKEEKAMQDMIEEVVSFRFSKERNA